MKIIFLTPGTGSYYCGACLRDNTLGRELHHAGHDVTIVPMYLPLMIDDEKLPGLEKAPILFGGINVYLQQKLAFFRKTPALFDRLLNSHRLLSWAARHSHMTSAHEHGEMTYEMLNVENSDGYRKEWQKLLSWIGPEKPDLVCLSNALLAGFAAELKRHLGVPVVTFFQGEDSFLDSLPEPWRSRCWDGLARKLGASDVLLAPSRYYAEFMCQRLALGPGAITVVHNGIRLDGYGPADTPPASPTIGYLAKMSREKGLELVVDAFLVLARDGDTRTRLRIGGAATAGDEPLIAQLKNRIVAAGLESRVDWSRNLTREQKIAFLRSLTIFSVPAVYVEAFGLYVLEAMACGVPVVQPDACAFGEIIELTGGGVCVAPHDAVALARGWRQLLADEKQRMALGRAARLGVEKHFGARTMCEQFCRVVEHFAPATTT